MSQDKPEDLAPRDATILRPRPGAGRRPAPVSGPADGGQAARAPNSQLSSPAPQARYSPPGSDAAGQRQGSPDLVPSGQQQGGYQLHQASGTVEQLTDYSAASTNPLVQAAVPLLVLAGRLRGQIANADIESLRHQAVDQMRKFEERARRAEVPAEDVLAARYALCTVLDEAVLNTPWGAEGSWSAQSLLVTFHREAAGGEKFFQILDRVSGDPQRYLALLELLYVCLALGFEGKYRLDDRGAARLTEIRESLYQRIESLRESAEPELSPRWKGVEDRRNAVIRFVPLWVVVAACLAGLVGTYIYLDTKLGTRAEPVSAMLARVGLESLDPVLPAAAGTPTSGLRQLLAQQIASGRISVEESGERTLVTLTASDLFASGSATLNPTYETLVREVGQALDSVPGRILVIGHTDDQPLRSLRFKDNYELSRSRALQVADLLRNVVKDTSRIEAAGKGSLEPRYLPAGLPANRARNRRVEIIHRRAS